MPAVISAENTSDGPEPQGLDPRVEEPRVAPADVDVDAPRERGGEQRADAGEGHLAEGQLARPTGEDRERQGADGEAEDRGVQQVAGRLR